MSGPFVKCDRCMREVPVGSTHMVLNFSKDAVLHLCEFCTADLRSWMNSYAVAAAPKNPVIQVVEGRV